MKEELKKIRLTKKQKKILKGVGMIAAVAGAFILGERYAEISCAFGLKEAYDSGLYQFTDPETKEVIPVETAVELFKEHFNK